MSIIHPSWQATDSDEQPVRITARGQHRDVARQSASFSRMPAALTGIVLCVAIGYLVFEGIGGIRGQVSEATETIRLLTTGPEPTSLTLRPGESVEFVNEDTIPHILLSETLPMEEGIPFRTPTMFPQGRYIYIVPMDAPSGTHEYLSQTSNAVMGEIVIDAEGSDGESTLPSSSAMRAEPSSSSRAFVPTPAVTTTVSSSSVSLSGNIPVNLHTIGTQGTVPVRPLPPTRLGASVTQHVPATQPETGSPFWLIPFATIAVLLFVTRKTFRSI